MESVRGRCGSDVYEVMIYRAGGRSRKERRFQEQQRGGTARLRDLGDGTANDIPSLVSGECCL